MLFWCGIFYYIAENSFSTTFRPEKTTFRPDFSHKALKYDIIQVPKEEQEVRKMKKLFQKYASGVPSSEIRTSQYNYASMNSSDPAITVQLTTCRKSSNTTYCRMSVPNRAYTEDEWESFSYQYQTKDIALTSHGTKVYFTVEMVRVNENLGYGNCAFGGTAN